MKSISIVYILLLSQLPLAQARDTVDPVNLIYPNDGQEIHLNSTPVLFEWSDPNPRASGVEYQIIVSRLSKSSRVGRLVAGTSEVVVMDTKTKNFRIASLLGLFVSGPQYRWRVRAIYPGGAPAGAWSAFRNVTFKEDPTPTILGEYCPNGGLENNNYSNWSGATGAIGNTTWTNGFAAGRFQIMNAGAFDPKVGGGILPVVPSGGGSHSIRMGNFYGALQKEQLTYNFTVDHTNKDFRFQFALVLYDPTDHKESEKPSFSYAIQVNNGSSWQNILAATIVSNRSNPYFEISGNDPNLIYKLWNCNRVDLSAHIGKSSRIVFTTQDCTQGAPNHFAVAYIDGICGDENDIAPIPQFYIPSELCLSDPTFMADGSASQREIDYFWSVEKCDAAGNPIPGTEKSQWYNGAEAGLMDVKSLYTSRGGVFECNSYYKVRLRVSNDCVGNREMSKVIFLRCPSVPTVGDVPMCCNNSASTITLGIPNNPNHTYSWVSTPSGQVYATSTITVPRPPSGLEQYNFVVTDQYGCSIADLVNIYTTPRFDLSLSNSGCTPCQNTTLQAQVSSSSIGCLYPPASTSQLQSIGVTTLYTYQWSSGAGNTNTNAVYTETDKTVSVTVTDGCSTQTKNTTVKRNKIVGDFPRLTFASALKPDYSDPLKHLLVLDQTLVTSGDPSTGTIGSLNYGYKPAYNATAYRLYVTDRWGIVHKVKERTLADCNGLSNGEIEWDGKINGTIVQQGVYNWFLELDNCDTHKDTLDWYQLVCTKYGWALSCLCNTCKKYEWKNVTQRINSVTVIR